MARCGKPWHFSLFWRHLSYSIPVVRCTSTMIDFPEELSTDLVLQPLPEESVTCDKYTCRWVWYLNHRNPSYSVHVIHKL